MPLPLLWLKGTVMQIQILVIQVPDMWKWSSKFSILKTYIVRYYLTLKFCLQVNTFEESDKKYATSEENDKFYRWISAEVQIMGMRGILGTYNSNTLETFINSSAICMAMPLSKHN